MFNGMMTTNRPKNSKYYIIRTYYEAGKLYETAWWKEEELHGVRRRYLKTGGLYREDQFVDGELHGVEKYFNKACILTQEINYDNGEANWCRFYYNTGELMEEGTYIKGVFKSTAQYNLKGKRINIAGGRARKAEMDAKENKLNYQKLLNLNPKLADFKEEFDLDI